MALMKKEEEVVFVNSAFLDLNFFISQLRDLDPMIDPIVKPESKEILKNKTKNDWNMLEEHRSQMKELSLPILQKPETSSKHSNELSTIGEK